MSGAFTVTCPCCQGRLTIDPDLRAVIAHEAPPRARSGPGLEGALEALKDAAARRQDQFQEQLEAQRHKGRLLDRKFQEGLKKAKDDPSRPPNPLDLD
jgi:hypothetical protein